MKFEVPGEGFHELKHSFICVNHIVCVEIAPRML